MKNKIALLTVAIVCALSVAGVYAQTTSSDEGRAAANAPLAAAADAVQPAKEAMAQQKSQNIYGEVQAVNASGGTMTVQYYDYDADEEKVIELTVSGDTRIENAPALADVKKGDWVDATFVAEGSKNTANAITVEKEEEVPTETMPEGEMKE